MSPGDPPAAPQSGSVENQQVASPHQPTALVGPTAPSSGRRAALRDLRRQLTDDELANPGVHKLLLDEIERADLECSELREYREKYFVSERSVAVLQEKVRAGTALEIMFGVGVGLG